jgi:hypothetical protein
MSNGNGKSNDNGVRQSAIKRALLQLLSEVPPDVNTCIINAKRLGHYVEEIPAQSRQTLTRQQIQTYTYDMIEIYKKWSRSETGWEAEEVAGAFSFKVRFTRFTGDK